MKIIALLALVALTAGCHRSPADKHADQQAADARADVLDNYSDLLDAQAKQKQDNRQSPQVIEGAEGDNIAASVP